MKNYRAGFLRSNNFVKYSRHYITILYSYWNIEDFGKLFKKNLLNLYHPVRVWDSRGLK